MRHKGEQREAPLDLPRRCVRFWNRGLVREVEKCVRRFKFWPSIRKSYEEQGEIFFKCRRYEKQTKSEQRKIDRLIHRAGEAYANALREYLLTETSWETVCQQWYVSDRTLQRCVRRFFEAW